MKGKVLSASMHLHYFCRNVLKHLILIVLNLLYAPVMHVIQLADSAQLGTPSEHG